MDFQDTPEHDNDDASAWSVISDPGYLEFLNVLQSNKPPMKKVPKHQEIQHKPEIETALLFKPSTDLEFRRSLDEEGKKELLLFYEAPSSYLQYILKYQPTSSFGFVKGHVHEGLSDDEITLYDADESVRGVFRPNNAAGAKVVVETSSSIVSQLSIQLSASSQESLPESLYDGPKVYIEGKVIPPSPSSQGDDESFYVGPGEENFVNNGSVQESDISESTDEIVSIEGSRTSEVQNTKPSMLAALGVASSVTQRIIGDNERVHRKSTGSNPADQSKALSVPVVEKTSALVQPKDAASSSQSEGYNEFVRTLMTPTIAVSVTDDGSVTLSVSLKDQEVGSVTLAMKDEASAKQMKDVAKSKDGGFEEFMLFLKSSSPHANKELTDADKGVVAARSLTDGPVEVTEPAELGHESVSDMITKATAMNSISKVREAHTDGSIVEDSQATTVSQNTTPKKFLDATKEHCQPKAAPSSEPETENGGLFKFLGAAAVGATGAVAAKFLGTDDQKKEGNKVVEDNESSLPVMNLQEPQGSDDSNGLVTAAAIGGVVAVSAANEKSLDSEVTVKSIESSQDGYDDFLPMLQSSSSPKTKELNLEKFNSSPTSVKAAIANPAEEAEPVQACDVSPSKTINETAINEVITKPSSPEVKEFADAERGTLDTLNDLPAVLEHTGDDLASVVETVVSEETTPNNRLFYSRKKDTKAVRGPAQSQPVPTSEPEEEKKGIFRLIGAAATGAAGVVAAKLLASDHEKEGDVEAIEEGDKSISHLIKGEPEVNDDHFKLVTAAVIGGLAVAEAANSPTSDDIVTVKSSAHVDKGLDDAIQSHISPEINDLGTENANSLSNVVKDEPVEPIEKSKSEEVCDVPGSSEIVNAAPIKGAMTRSLSSESNEVKTKEDTQDRLDELPKDNEAIIKYANEKPVSPVLKENVGPEEISSKKIAEAAKGPTPKTEENGAFQLAGAVAAGAAALLLESDGDEKGDAEVVGLENKCLSSVAKEESDLIVHPSNPVPAAVIGGAVVAAAATKSAFSEDKVKEDNEVVKQRSKSLSPVTPEINTTAAIGGVSARSPSPEILDDTSIMTASSPMVVTGEESNRSDMSSPFSDISGIYFFGAELGEEDVTTRTCISEMYFSGAEFSKKDMIEFTAPKPRGGAGIDSDNIEASVNSKESLEDLPCQSVQSLDKVKSLEELVVRDQILSPFAIAGKMTVNSDFLQSISSVGSGSFDEFFDCLSQASQSSIQILDKTPPELGQSGSSVMSLEDFYSCMSEISFKSTGTGSDSELSRAKSADYVIRTFLLSLVFHLCQFKAESGVAEICIWGHLYMRFIRDKSLRDKSMLLK